MASGVEQPALHTLRQIVEELSGIGEIPEEYPRLLALYAQGLKLCDQEKHPSQRAAFYLAAGHLLMLDPGETRPESIEQAIRFFDLALTTASREAAPVEWARIMERKGVAYRTRFYGDAVENVEQAIACLEAALTILTPERDANEWAEALFALANAVGDRMQGTRADNQERAIALYLEALSPPSPEIHSLVWAAGIRNLACTCVERIRGERTENLARAIGLFYLSLQVTTREAAPFDWSIAKFNMANAYAVLTLGDPEQNRLEAISHYQDALTVITKETMPVRWAQTTANLANTYVALNSGDRAQHLETGIALYQDALSVITQDRMPAHWAAVMINLGNAYRHRIMGNRAENQERAIELYEAALTMHASAAMTLEWAQIVKNLGIIHLERVHGTRIENVERAIAYHRAALTVLTMDAMPLDHCHLNADLGDLFLERGDWPSAITAYQSSLEALDIILEETATPDAWLAELQTVEHVPVHLAYCLLRQDIAQPLESVLVLERWRARSMGEALKLNEPALEDLAEKDRLLLEICRSELNELRAEARLPQGTPGRSPYTELASALRYVRSKLSDVIAQIRCYLPEFLSRPREEDVLEAAATGTVIYLLATPVNGFALAVSAQESKASYKIISLPLLNTETFRSEFTRYWKMYRARTEAPSGQEQRKALDRLLQWLWNAAMRHIVPLLSPEQITVLIPTGLLGLVPLHAAWTNDSTLPGGRRYALDSGIITYSPSARMLASAAGKVAIAADSVLVVDEPRNFDLPALPNSSREADAVLSCFNPEKTVLFRHEQATRSQVMETCKNYSVLHFACHAMAKLAAPLESGLVMADGEWLTLRDLLGLRTENARLAVLSACETGMLGAALPDETLGLPAGLLQAGVAGVIATMWAVSDASTTLLMVRFYDLWRREKLHPAAALRQAQLWLRDTTHQEKEDYFKRCSSENLRLYSMASSAWPADNMPASNSRPFAHPYHWAGFSYFGA
jgi:CHAT domain-containing protein